MIQEGKYNEKIEDVKETEVLAKSLYRCKRVSRPNQCFRDEVSFSGEVDNGKHDGVPC